MIILPWPPQELNPNGRAHFMKKARATKAYRQIAGLETKVSKIKVIGTGPIDLHVAFYPPDISKRDRDNMQASCKAFFDGIADALGVNDNLFRPTYSFCEPVKGGRVTVEVNKK